MNNYQKAAAAIASVCISLGLLSFVEDEEGFGPRNAQGLYVAYADPSPATGWRVGTICNGHTRGVKQGDTATKQQCETFLKEDLEIAAKGVLKCLKVPVTHLQMDALTSFNFNTGAACRAIIPYVNTKPCMEAAKAFNEIPQHNKDGTIRMLNGKPVMQYTTGGGVLLRGLVSRRAKERAMFEEGCVK